MPSFILDTVERTSLGTTLATDLSGGTLKIYSGAYATGTLLATFTLPSLSGSNVSGGVLTLPAIAQVNAVAPGTAAATYSAGATIVVRSIGTSYYLFYNNAYVGSGTISDAGVRSGTACGLYTDTITSNTFDNFVTYASGTGEEYESALNPWSFPYLSGTMAAALAQESADFEGFPQVTGTVSPILAAILAKIYGFPVKPPPIAIDSPEGIAIELVCAEKILSMLKYYSKNLPKPADVLSKFRYLRRICK
ncbi:MAG: hypothetical protein ABSG90_11620 [Dehalococcoidia bacterium]|jgi:hypothetical protein